MEGKGEEVGFEIGWEVLEVKYLVVSRGYRLSLDSMSFSPLVRVFSSFLVFSRDISRNLAKCEKRRDHAERCEHGGQVCLRSILRKMTPTCRRSLLLKIKLQHLTCYIGFYYYPSAVRLYILVHV